MEIKFEICLKDNGIYLWLSQLILSLCVTLCLSKKKWNKEKIDAIREYWGDILCVLIVKMGKLFICPLHRYRYSKGMEYILVED